MIKWGMVGNSPDASSVVLDDNKLLCCKRFPSRCIPDSDPKLDTN